MPIPRKPPHLGPRRRGTRAETREQLVAATLELLRTGGETAVTTVSVTHAAGIVQSAFYKHFSNLDECLAESAERVARQVREAVADSRRAMYQSGPGTGDDLERFYRGVFALVDRQRAMMELFLRYRGDPRALGGVMHRLARDLRLDLARDLAVQAVRVGLTPPPMDWMEGLAENLMGASLAAVEAWMEGRGRGVEESSRLLAAFSTGACIGVYEALNAVRE